MALVADIFDAPTSGGGIRVRDGKGLFTVTKIEIDRKRRGQMFIAEFTVHASQKTPVVALKFPEPGKLLDIEPNGAGTTCSIAIPLNDPKILSGPGNVKAFTLSLLGYDEAQVQKEDFKKAIAELADLETTGEPLPPSKRQNPARGMLIGYETYRVLTKAQDKELVLVKGSHVGPGAGNSAPEIAARRKALDGLKADNKT